MEQTLRDWIATERPKLLWRQTVSGVAARQASGDAFDLAVREFLDEFGLRPTPELRLEAIAQRPAETGERRYDAFLAALAEHLAVVHGLRRPDWTVEQCRFLDRFWFWSDVPGFRALQIAESPASFRRRGIFISEGALRRV